MSTLVPRFICSCLLRFPTKVPRSMIKQTVQEPEILERFDAVLDMLHQNGACIVDEVEYPSWTPEFSDRTIPFVWAQLKQCKSNTKISNKKCSNTDYIRAGMDSYFDKLEVNPANIKSMDDLLVFMQSQPKEKMAEFGAARFEKAQNETSIDFEDAFAQRLSKGSEVSAILDTHKCDALLMPVGCRNPADLGQCPIMSLPMGYYSAEKEPTLDKYGMTLTGPNVP